MELMKWIVGRLRCILMKIGCMQMMVDMMVIDNFEFPCNSMENLISIWNFTINEGDQFKVNVGEKKWISKIDIEMYLTLLDNI